MGLLDNLAEARIREAMEAGDFDDLPGRGQRIELEDDALVPEDLRVAWRLLKNAGYLPPNLQLRRDIADVNVLLQQAQLQEERLRLSRRLRYLLQQLAHSERGDDTWMDPVYMQQLIGRFEEQ